MKQCIIPAGSVTRAVRGQQQLADRRISARIVRLDNAGSGGCSFGLELDCRFQREAARILAQGRIV